MLPSFNVVVPARLASTRLPDKPLLDIAGKPMIIHVLEKAHASGAKEVWVATDAQKIISVVEQYGYRAALTLHTHVSGTDRIAELVTSLGWGDNEIVVNVQGDEPTMDPKLIAQVAAYLTDHPDISMASAAHVLRDEALWLNPNIVKVVLNTHYHALYFSRAPIPFVRDARNKMQQVYRHIGIYAYRVGFLKKFTLLEKAPLENIECLEQLRALWHGHTIGMVITPLQPVGVDTQTDLDAVRALLA